MENYVEAWIKQEMTLCEAYKCLYDELAKSGMAEQRTLDLLEQRKQLRAYMADLLMQKMGYVSHNGMPEENCYPAKVWEVAE